MVSAKRVKNISISRPIEYGNVASPLESKDRKKDTPAEHTHKWTVFVRDPAGKDDMSYIIKKVLFKLHDTYQNSTRTLERPPYEVTETGWGEFEIAIRIFLVPQAGEKQIVLYHHLKLHPYGPGVDPSKPQKVSSVLYDELVFNEPTEPMFDTLTSRPGAQLMPRPNPPLLPFSQQTENEELDRLTQALDTIYQQVQKVKERITELDKEKAELKVKEAKVES